VEKYLLHHYLYNTWNIDGENAMGVAASDRQRQVVLLVTMHAIAGYE
jgi:hypothetical protein